MNPHPAIRTLSGARARRLAARSLAGTLPGRVAGLVVSLMLGLVSVVQAQTPPPKDTPDSPGQLAPLLTATGAVKRTMAKPAAAPSARMMAMAKAVRRGLLVLVFMMLVLIPVRVHRQSGA